MSSTCRPHGYGVLRVEDRADRGAGALRLAAGLLLTALLAGCGVHAWRGSQQLPAVDDDSAAPLRVLADLDVTGDGWVTSQDAQLFQNAFEAARARFGDAIDIVLRPRSGASFTAEASGGVFFYDGPPPGAAPVLGLVRFTGDSSVADIAGVPARRVLELAIEARWMALQVRLLLARPPRDGSSQGRLAANPQPIAGALIAGALRHVVPGYGAGSMPIEQVCRAMARLDLEDYRRAGLQPSAVFDLDSTVWDGNIIDVFLAALVESDLPTEAANAALKPFLKTLSDVDVATVDGNTPTANAALLLEHIRARAPVAGAEVSSAAAFEQVVGLLQGLEIERVREAARVAWEVGAAGLPPWKDRIFGRGTGCSMQTVIAELQHAGVAVYLLSATLDVLASEAGRSFGVAQEQVLGSVLEVLDGRYTGRVLATTYYHKGAITRQWLPAPPVVAFGDSPHSDFVMLAEAVGAAFMVNPRSALLERDEQLAGGRMVAIWFDEVGGMGPVTETTAAQSP